MTVSPISSAISRTHAGLERLAGLDETCQQREQPLGPHGLAGEHRAVVAVMNQADHRGVDARELLVTIGRVDPRPAGLDRLCRCAIDRAEARVVMPIQQCGGRRDELCADVVEDLPGPAQVEHLGFGVGIIGSLKCGANRPHVPAVGQPAQEHGVLRWLVAQLWRHYRAPPDRRRSAPGCGGRPAAARRLATRRAPRRRRCGALSARSTPTRDSSGTLRS